MTVAEMKALEDAAFARGVAAESLMEDAGAQIAAAVRQVFPQPGRCLVYFGKGHNGGDALVAARHLAAAGWNLALPVTYPESAWSPLTGKKYRDLQRVDYSGESPDSQPLIVLDGLLGIGAGGALRDPIKRQTRAINMLRATQGARVFAIDVPTGLNADTGAADPDTVVADFTLTIGAAKVGLLADAATRWVGRLALLSLAELIPPDAPAELLATPATLGPTLPRRSFDLHKGECGRVGIVAGSSGMIGAAVLCAEGALHAGAGLITLYVPAALQSAVVARITPEVMVRAVGNLSEVFDARHDVLAVGPGLGRERDAEICELIARASQPLVIDADALTALAGNLDLLRAAAGPLLLTPHPGEMVRLAPDSMAQTRREIVESFTAQHSATLLFKGARTIVAERGQPLSFNTTGSPGMASGGMGDVLTGVCAGLAAQGLAFYDAARLGAWLCGRSAEFALFAGESEESLSATHILAHLGPAFRALRAGGY